MATTSVVERRGHVCPPSNAKHPSDRWESLLVYSFICKFTNLRAKVEGLETPMDLENALLDHEPNNILAKVLSRFVLNLRPQTRNLSVDQISSTLASIMSEHFKTSERTVFWNDALGKNMDPFESMEGGIFAADWDLKLKMLRILVEMQLMHTPEIKDTIDRAWGVVHSKQKKESSVAWNTPNPPTVEQLQQIPLGQDMERRRYWVADDSPRVYISTNPWKVTATFETVSSTKEEYLALIERLKDRADLPDRKGRKTSKHQVNHRALITALESRIEAIDAELARVQRVRRKIEARNALMAQAEIRATRTRRQTHRPDYVYNDVGSEDEGDEYRYQEDEDEDEFEEDDYANDGSNGSRWRQRSSGRRRSARAAALNANEKRASGSKSFSDWRGERRSARLGAPPERTESDEPPAPKRARTEESTISAESAPGPVAADKILTGSQSNLKIKINGAAAVKPTETVVEHVAGKKKSKFWVYAVEPIQAPRAPTSTETTSAKTESSGSSRQTDGTNHRNATPPPLSNDELEER